VHESGANAVVCDKENQRLYSAGEDKTIVVYDLATGQVCDTWESTGGILALALIPMAAGDLGCLASTSENGSVSLWDCATGECIDTTTSSSNEATSICLIGERVYVGGNDRLISEFAVDSWIQGRVFRGHSGFVSSLIGTMGEDDASSGVPGGPRLFSGSWDGSVKIWDLVSGVCVDTIPVFQGRSVNALCLCPGMGVGGGALLVCGGSNGDIKVFDLATGKLTTAIYSHPDAVAPYLLCNQAEQTVKTRAGREIHQLTIREDSPFPDDHLYTFTQDVLDNWFGGYQVMFTWSIQGGKGDTW
ncbi:hypothetical protein HDU98_001541, partial [Podochytrium sp. JEL0797]